MTPNLGNGILWPRWTRSAMVPENSFLLEGLGARGSARTSGSAAGAVQCARLRHSTPAVRRPPADAGHPVRHREHRRHRHDRADQRRERCRQGSRRARRSRRLDAPPRAVRQGQLRRDPTRSARVRAVRSRARRLHRCVSTQARPVRVREQGHHLSRRDRRAAHGSAGQAPPRPARLPDVPRGRHRNVRYRRARDRRDESRPGNGDDARRVP